MPLSDSQTERYSRQIILPQIGGRGQERLLRSAVALVGTGAVARVAALYLAGAGVGRLTLYAPPGDEVVAAAPLLDELVDLNPDVHLEAEPLPDGPGWAARYAVVVESTGRTDSIARVAREARDQERPLVCAGSAPSGGWLTITAGDDPRAVCPACAARTALSEAAARLQAVLAPTTAGVIGSLQAAETLALCFGLGGRAPSGGTWWHYDAGAGTLETRVSIPQEGCSVCAPTATAD